MLHHSGFASEVKPKMNEHCIIYKVPIYQCSNWPAFTYPARITGVHPYLSTNTISICLSTCLQYIIHISMNLCICISILHMCGYVTDMSYPYMASIWQAICQVTGALQSADLSRKLILHDRQQPSRHVLGKQGNMAGKSHIWPLAWNTSCN